MSIQIKDVADILYNKHTIPRTDIERMLKSEFKLLANTIRLKGTDKVNLIYLGKWKATPYRLKTIKGEINEVVKEV